MHRLASLTLALVLLCPLALGQNGPPSPGPSPKPVDPNPISTPDFVPTAMVLGSYWPNPSAPPGVVMGMFRLDASGSASTEAVEWMQKSGPETTLLILTPKKGPAESYLEAIVSAPGSYTFKAVVQGTKNGKPHADADEWSYTLAAPAPVPSPTPPSPNPSPVPSPSPTPDPTKGTFLVVIANAADPTLDATINGPTLGNLIDAQQAKVFAPTDPQVTAKGYDRAMVAKGLTSPCALLLDFRTGRVLSAFALPTTDAALAAQLAKPHFH